MSEQAHDEPIMTPDATSCACAVEDPVTGVCKHYVCGMDPDPRHFPPGGPDPEGRSAPLPYAISVASSDAADAMSRYAIPQAHGTSDDATADGALSCVARAG